MTSATIVESRRIELSVEAVLECILEADRDLGGKLWRSTIHGAMIVSEPAIAAKLRVTKPGENEPCEVIWEGPQLAAAMIRLCSRLRIPLQRSASKRVEAAERSLTLVTESSLRIPRTLGADVKLESQPAAVP
jgi:hypothetical protein